MSTTARTACLLPLLALALGACSEDLSLDSMTGFHWSVPQRAAASFSLLSSPPSWDKGALVFQMIPGVAAGKLCAGYAWSEHLGEMGDNIMFVKVSGMWTWGEPVGSSADQAYLGIEWQQAPIWPIFMYTVGIYWHVHGDAEDQDPLLSYGIGLNF